MMRLSFLIGCVFLMVSLQAQSPWRLEGQVRDASGQALVGASVQVEGGPGQITDSRGRFALALREVPPNLVLEVRFLGYQVWRQTLEAPIPTQVDIVLEPMAYSLQGLELIGTWAGLSAPFTSTRVTREELEERNMGQDIPWLLRFTPGLVASSDAGTGIGYTGFRIRGSDPTRINVTVNGVPLNDSESQAVFWVNMPDFAASTDQIEIQRGVGTSTNGAGAFGATVNLQSMTLRDQAYGELTLGGGAFGTQRARVAFGTGTLPNGWSLDGRWSLIRSDGYIDRASADLRSLYGSLTWNGRRTLFRMLVFSGNERTYQAWWGTPQARLENDVEGMQAHADRNGFSAEQTRNLLESGRTYNYYQYDNEIDLYAQTHWQAHLAHALDRRWRANLTMHYTRGEGYFEQFRQNERLTRYGLEPLVIGGETISRFDVVRRRWLDNHFAGLVGNLRYEGEHTDLHVGGGWNRYLGDHFGRITWASLALTLDPDHQYYFGDAQKTDGNVFIKGAWRFSPGWEAYADLQYREVRYRTQGTENNLRDYDVDVRFPFFNPKAGISWSPGRSLNIYGSVAVGQREPVRRDFVDAPAGQTPRAERMINLESGLRWQGRRWGGELNLFHMDYRDQLVPTGALNDVGASLLTNVARSHRSGLELAGSAELGAGLDYRISLAWNISRVREFQELIYDYTDGFEENRITHRGTPIAFSPEWVASQQLRWRIRGGWSLSWLSQFVGPQFLDNTGDPGRALDAWWVQDLLLAWEGRWSGVGRITVRGQINNLLDHKFSNNGYTYTYRAGATITENFFYPQAGRHGMIAATWSF
jgi:iron complex outermembrane recepter protein